MKVVICHGFVSHFFCKSSLFFYIPTISHHHPGNPKNIKRQRCRTSWRPEFLTFCRSEPEADMSCSICLEGFCADPEQTTCFFLGKQGCFLGKPKKVTSWISVAWVRFNLWMAYLYHRLILRCEIQSLNSDVQSNHGFGISYILWSTYIYLADSMAIRGRCIPTKSDLYLVHVWNFQVYKVGSYRGL